MEATKVLNFVEKVINNMPQGWLSTTTHRLDIYVEELAKTQFTEQLESLFLNNISDARALSKLPTAYDYIRLGHPLSCVLEWAVAKLLETKAKNVISFSSNTMPLLSILRKNLFAGVHTQIFYSGSWPKTLNQETLREVYGYKFDIKHVNTENDIPTTSDINVYIDQLSSNFEKEIDSNIDFHIRLNDSLGSLIIVNGEANESYVSEIQHVRRRETIAMTPSNALKALKTILDNTYQPSIDGEKSDKQNVLESIQSITKASTSPLVASSGLSIQYAILMGLIHDAKEKHGNKAIKIIVPPNCYGGTNDQARRVAACINNVDVVDLPVDGDSDMVQSIDKVLNAIAKQDAIPYIIAEIPTNPRVEVPNLEELKRALSEPRNTPEGKLAIDPVFILDQTFCPNVSFVGNEDILANVRTISFASGSKFPSGGQCTSGYCVGNAKANELMEKIELHLTLCDNEATNLQYQILAKQLPSMIQRIADAYTNTRAFVSYIEEVLPTTKINFVSEDLAKQGFTPSVFSLDLPTKGNTPEEREEYKRALNLKLINLMITEIPDESKYCVSYGQLKGCYWTIPATSTQGTTKEGDKDYIARVALSANLNLEKHKQVFLDFVKSI
jgi:cystathionine beta-lyase/cystathionine gamma-synthase